MSAVSTLPLLSRKEGDAPLAWRGGSPISAARFLADAAALAERLPAAGAPANICGSHYQFAVGFAAALMREQSSLFPPDARPATLVGLRGQGAQPYVLTGDASLVLPGIECVVTTDAPAAERPWHVPAIRADLPAASLLTSGSTGVPKAHTKTWRSLVENVGAAASRLAQCLELPTLEGLSLVVTVPSQHSYGFESGVLLAMLGGAAFDTSRPFYPADIVEALERVPRPRALVTTPFHLKTLLLAGIDLPPTDLILSATAPLSPQLAAEAERVMGAQLIEIYGCTEAGQVATRRPSRGEVWHAFGDLRLHAEQGEDGAETFFVSGGHVHEATPLADVLELIDDQHFRLLGRANDLVHVAGKRTSLAHLNFHLNSIPGVQDGAFWLPDEVADAVVRPVAFVVAPELRAAQISAALRERLDAVFVPRRIVRLPRLPREATGKLTANTLRELTRQHVAARR